MAGHRLVGSQCLHAGVPHEDPPDRRRPAAQALQAGRPTGMVPKAGEPTHYAPWGNLAIFIKPRAHSRSLLPLGKVDDGGG